jgi:hypothetical protein
MYPMVTVNHLKFFQSGAILERTFSSHSSDVGAALLRVVRWAVRHEPKRFNSSVIPTEKYAIIHTLISVTRKVFGVILERGGSRVYAAVPFENKVIFAKAPPTTLAKVLADPSLFTAEALATYFSDTNQKPTEINWSAGSKWNIARCESGLHWFRSDDSFAWGCARREIHYDPAAVNQEIISKTPPTQDNLDIRAGRAVYTNYLYQLFVNAFIDYINSERNEPLRKQLGAVIASADFNRGMKKFKQSIEKLIPREDFLKITEKISSMILLGTFTRKRLSRALDQTNFSFDQLTLNEVTALDKEHAAIKMRGIATEFAVFGRPPSDAQFQNIYIGCAGDDRQMFCRGKKLICDRPLEELADLLAGDLLNPLMRRYIFESSQSHVDYFKFIVRPHEILTLYQQI